MLTNVNIIKTVLMVVLILLSICISYLLGFKHGQDDLLHGVKASQTWIGLSAEASQELINLGYEKDFYRRIEGGNSIRPSNINGIYDLYYDKNKMELRLKVKDGIVSIIHTKE